MMRDPLAAALYCRGTYHGMKGFGESIVPISPDERDRIIKRLEMDRLDMICTGCGSTKPESYYASIGAHSCCDSRKMVPVTNFLADLAETRAKLTAVRKKTRRKPRPKAAQ